MGESEAKKLEEAVKNEAKKEEENLRIEAEKEYEKKKEVITNAAKDYLRVLQRALEISKAEGKNPKIIKIIEDEIKKMESIAGKEDGGSSQQTKNKEELEKDRKRIEMQAKWWIEMLEKVSEIQDNPNLKNKDKNARVIDILRKELGISPKQYKKAKEYLKSGIKIVGEGVGIITIFGLIFFSNFFATFLAEFLKVGDKK